MPQMLGHFNDPRIGFLKQTFLFANTHIQMRLNFIELIRVEILKKPYIEQCAMTNPTFNIAVTFHQPEITVKFSSDGIIPR